MEIIKRNLDESTIEVSAINKEYIKFFGDFFEDENRGIDLLKTCYEMSEQDVRPRRIINNIARLISLGDELISLKPGRHGLAIFYWIVSIEAVSNIANQGEKERYKIKIIRDFFEEYINEIDKEFLLRHIERAIIDMREENSSEISLSIIATIFYNIRHDFVHEGIYSNFHFSSANEERVLNSLVMKEHGKDVEEERTYYVSITYEQMRKIIINGLLNLLKRQMDN
ncbi:hypothetical protein CDO73_12100 [Saccharibacillus sp. O23]|uniref:hypothetical protein n=1 Tax=Saccharibacillus sp. O23 TaxID=2009338 RepID=UPI000B4E432D|nr:hypothetical protein [Saccharibacillus sp. O23]OWR29825.1 hypothetical protein CDO73_12100 [Saccharibacillus sp. O23]